MQRSQRSGIERNRLRIENLRNLPVCRRGGQQVLDGVEGQAGIGQFGGAGRRNPQFDVTPSDNRGNISYCRACAINWFRQYEMSESRVRSRSRRERAMANTTICLYRTHSGDSSRNTRTSRKCEAKICAHPASCGAGRT